MLNVIGFFAVVTNATMVCFVGSQLVKRPGPPGAVKRPPAFPIVNQVLYGAFVWAHRALNRQKRRFPARAVSKNPDQRLAETDMMQICIPGQMPCGETCSPGQTPCEHCFSIDNDGTCELREGIWVRLFSQSLWMYSVAVEHIVMLVCVREKQLEGFRSLT